MMKNLLRFLFFWLVATHCAFAAVNINTATREELEKLTGVGPVKAQAIIEDRKKHGLYTNIEDIKRVKGIGEVTFDRLKGEISVTSSGDAAKPAKAPARPGNDERKPATK